MQEKDMKLSVCQRIVLTIGVTLVLFLATSSVAYFSFNSVSQQVNQVIHEAAPRVNISASLRANLADTKYILLEYLTTEASDDAHTQKVTQQLKQSQSDFQANFNALIGIEGQTDAVQKMESVTAQVFQLAEQIVAQKARYLSEQQHIATQAEEYKYLAEELGFTLADLLHEEFRYEFLKLVKPMQDDIAYLVGKVAALMQETDPAKMDKILADINIYVGRIDQAQARLKAFEEDAYDSVAEIWVPYKAQLTEEDLTLSSYLQAQEAQRNSAQLLKGIEQRVSENETLIAQFIHSAQQQGKVVELQADETISNGKVLIVLGTLAAAVISVLFSFRLVSHLQRSLRQVVEGMGRIASGELTTQLEVKGSDELASLAESTNALSKDLRHLVEQIVTTVNEVHNTAKTSSDISRETLNGVEQQSLQSARLAATATQMEASASEVAQHAEQTLNDAMSAQQTLQTSNGQLLKNSQSISQLAKQVTRSMQGVKDLKAHSDSISDVINVIREIAEQTNLLALNAAIEAARAGETGRGFSVVADEVRSLANRTQGSISAIEEMVSNLQQGAENAVNTMSDCSEEAMSCSQELDRCTHEINQVVAAVERMREMNSHVANATDEQSATVGDISQSLGEINLIMATTTDGAERSAGQSEFLLDLSDSLNGLVRRFRV
ncbi:Methyl-accepting chemotaxis protein (contains HAMP domain) [Oceanospirillum sp. MED92]|uniref:Methyl-accepting chemotaxis protein (Contains HAMP domain) n=1 Tax=Neptuniibacter caesariensis TaxID=207954 RepID=A0A7U8C383_NEPCE|nr:Methyl-accepting chemotaxis protein (contains HAMP domain) [Oceanospirillum sp. MED92] [Neptuniibacter caesariensis]